MQNYYIRQAFACSGSSSSDSGGGTVPGVGQYTKGLTLPYNQRHGRSMRSTEQTIPSRKHTFGDEKYDDSFMQKSFARSSSVSGDMVPGVGQYTKTVAIPYYQRHSASRSKSPSQFQRHTWGSEKYDSFNNDYNGDDGRYEESRGSQGGLGKEGKSTHSEPDESRSIWAEQFEDSYSSKVRSAGHSVAGSSRGRSPSRSSVSRSPSRCSGSRGSSRGGDGRGPPRTPGEHRLRRLLTLISGMGSEGMKP